MVGNEDSSIPLTQSSHTEIFSTIQSSTKDAEKPCLWREITIAVPPNVKVPRSNHFVSQYATEDDRIFILGGLTIDSEPADFCALRSNVLNNMFSLKTIESAPKNIPWISLSATICGNALVCFGGHKHDEDHPNDNHINLLNINSYKWTVPRAFGWQPSPRIGHAISVISVNPASARLYVYGGMLDNKILDDLAVYDLANFRAKDNEWKLINLSEESDACPALVYHSMISYGGKLWVFGGQLSNEGELNDEIYTYQETTMEWKLVELSQNDFKPPGLKQHACTLYRHVMCIYGGITNDGKPSSGFYLFNLKTLRWYELPDIPSKIKNESANSSLSVLKHDKLLLFGNSNMTVNMGHSGKLSSIVCYILDLSLLKSVMPVVFEKNQVEDIKDVRTPEISHSTTFRVNDSTIIQTPVSHTKDLSILTPSTPPKENTPFESRDVQSPQKLNDPINIKGHRGSNEAKARHTTYVPNTNYENVPISHTVAYSVFEDLRKQFYDLRTDIERNAGVASKTIRKLEKSIKEIKAIRELELGSLAERSLHDENDCLRNHIEQLENKVNIRICAIENMTEKLAENNNMISESGDLPNYKQAYETMNTNYNASKLRNQLLQNKLNELREHMETLDMTIPKSTHEIFNVLQKTDRLYSINYLTQLKDRVITEMKIQASLEADLSKLDYSSKKIESFRDNGPQEREPINEDNLIAMRTELRKYKELARKLEDDIEDQKFSSPDLVKQQQLREATELKEKLNFLKKEKADILHKLEINRGHELATS